MTADYRTLELGHAEVVDLLRTLARRGVPAWIRARGASMQPTIPHGSEICIEPVHPDVCRPGDVVLAIAASGLIVAHRIVRAEDARLWLQGDHCVKRDPPISRHDVLGRVTAVRSGGAPRPLRGTRPRSVRAVVARWYRHARRELSGRWVRYRKVVDG